MMMVSLAGSRGGGEISSRRSSRGSTSDCYGMHDDDDGRCNYSSSSSSFIEEVAFWGRPEEEAIRLVAGRGGCFSSRSPSSITGWMQKIHT